MLIVRIHFCQDTFSCIVGPPYLQPPLFSSYEEQQLSELKALVQAAEDSALLPVILLGDFNHSPALPSRGIEPELAGNYEWLASQGFLCAYVMKNGSCTWCEENALISHTDYNANTAMVILSKSNNNWSTTIGPNYLCTQRSQPTSKTTNNKGNTNRRPECSRTYIRVTTTEITCS